MRHVHLNETIWQGKDLDTGVISCQLSGMVAKIKFCGLKTCEAIDMAAELGAWKIGYIFFEKSPRHLAIEEAARLDAHARLRGLESIAVTVDAADDEIERILTMLKPSLLQLHGSETPERLMDLKSRYSVSLMKAISVHEAVDIDRAASYAEAADLILFDAKAPKHSDLPGGNGVFFDWSLLEGLAEHMDYVLSGGLDAMNVGKALLETHARFLDVSSGVESTPGEKDPARMRAFAEAVNRHDAA